MSKQPHGTRKSSGNVPPHDGGKPPGGGPPTSQEIDNAVESLQLPSIEELKKSRKEMSESISENDFRDELAEMFVYQGFDPNVIWAQLARLAGDLQTCRRDIINMVLLFVMRGNNIGKMVDSMPSKGIEVTRGLVARYNIKSKLPRNSRRSTITLARVAMTFPMVGMAAMVRLHRRFIPPIKEFAGKLHCLLRLSCATSYYTMSYRAHVYWLHLAYLVVLGSVIGDKNDSIGKLKNFVSAAQNSKPILQQEAWDFMNSKKLDVDPVHWKPVRSLLEGAPDETKLLDLVPPLENFFVSFMPPVEWKPYVATDDFFPSSDDTSGNVSITL